MSPTEAISSEAMNWDKIIWRALIGALAGMIVSLFLLPFDVHRAEWTMAVCSALGVFIGLLKIVDAEGPHPHKEDAHDL